MAFVAAGFKMFVDNVINDLILRNDEEEWFDFKENWSWRIGEYISEISNAAAVCGKNDGYIVWGINDKSHEITGTTMNYNCSYKNEPWQNYFIESLRLIANS